MSSADDIAERVRGIMADLFQIERAAIGGGSSRETIPDWDSANHLTLVLALEEEFGVTFDVGEIETMFSLEDIVGVLDGKA